MEETFLGTSLESDSLWVVNASVVVCNLLASLTHPLETHLGHPLSIYLACRGCQVPDTAVSAAVGFDAFAWEPIPFDVGSQGLFISESSRLEVSLVLALCFCTDAKKAF